MAGRGRPSLRLFRFVDRARQRHCRGLRHQSAKRDREDRLIVARHGDGTATPARPDRAPCASFGRRRRAGQLARGRSRRNHDRHGHAARGVSGCARRVHGHGCVADFSRPRADAPRRSHRDAGLGTCAPTRQARSPKTACRSPNYGQETATASAGTKFRTPPCRRMPGPWPSTASWPALPNRSTRWT